MESHVQFSQLTLDATQLHGKDGISCCQIRFDLGLCISHGQLQFIMQLSCQSIQLLVDFLSFLKTSARCCISAADSYDNSQRAGQKKN